MSKRQKRRTNEKRAVAVAREDADAQMKLAEMMYRKVEVAGVPAEQQQEILAMLVNECIRVATWQSRFRCVAWRAVMGDAWIWGFNVTHEAKIPEGA